MGQLPLIRAPRGNAAEMVARKLDTKLRDHLAASRGGNVFSQGSGGTGGLDGAFGRPLLVILDRNVDLVPMVSHSWTYQALVNDVLGMKLNRVAVEVSLFTCQFVTSAFVANRCPIIRLRKEENFKRNLMILIRKISFGLRILQILSHKSLNRLIWN